MQQIQKHKLFISPVLGFWIFSLFYIGFVVEPHLIFDGFGLLAPAPPSVYSGAQLKELFSVPGGVTMMVVGCLSQGYSIPGLGPLIIIFAAALLSLLARQHFNYALGKPCPNVLATLLGFLVLLAYSRYEDPLAACLAIALGLTFSWLFEKVAQSNIAYQIAAYACLVLAAFILAGSGGLLAFLLMTFIYQLFLHRSIGLLLLSVPVTGGLLWALTHYGYCLSLKSTLPILTPWSLDLPTNMKTSSRALLVALYSGVPIIAALLFLGKWFVGRCRAQPTLSRQQARHKKKKTNPTSSASKQWLKRFGKTVLLYAPFVAMAAGLLWIHQPLQKSLFSISASSHHKQWPTVLALARQLPKGLANIHCNHDINRALYHTGRLPYDLFTFPQQPAALFLTHEAKLSQHTELKLCDFYLELGHVNLAEKLASELLAAGTGQGIVLEKLAWISIIKGHPESAQVYLNALQNNWVCRDRAIELLHALRQGYTPTQQAYIDRIRSCMPRNSYDVMTDFAIEPILIKLLEQNRHNQMAFEYLMAYYQVTGQLDKLVANFKRFDDFQYPSMPVPYQEAALIYFGSMGKKVKESPLGIQPETVQRYRQFVKLRTIASRQKALSLQLIRDFGQSYFFYYSFGAMGVL